MDRKWTNWVTFGSVLMMIVGAFKLISGIIGLFRDEWLVLGYNGYLLVDLTGLAVWYICVGALLFSAASLPCREANWDGWSAPSPQVSPPSPSSS